MTQMPKFNFKSTLSEDEVKKEEASSGQKDQKVFQPGTYSLKVISAEYHNAMPGDPTWHGYKLRLGGLDSRSIGLYLGVPTSSPIYNKPGMSPRAKTFMFHKFRQFLRAIGEDPSVETLNLTISKLFKQPEVLVGAFLKADIGYRGPHSKFVEKGNFKLVDKDDKELSKDLFSDRDAVKAHAALMGLILEDFPEILKLHEKEVKEKDSADPWGE